MVSVQVQVSKIFEQYPTLVGEDKVKEGRKEGRCDYQMSESLNLNVNVTLYWQNV